MLKVESNQRRLRVAEAVVEVEAEEVAAEEEEEDDKSATFVSGNSQHFCFEQSMYCKFIRVLLNCI